MQGYIRTQILYPIHQEIRDNINVETKDMTYEELREYIDSKLNAKTRLVGQ